MEYRDRYCTACRLPPPAAGHSATYTVAARPTSKAELMSSRVRAGAGTGRFQEKRCCPTVCSERVARPVAGPADCQHSFAAVEAVDRRHAHRPDSPFPHAAWNRHSRCRFDRVRLGLLHCACGCCRCFRATDDCIGHKSVGVRVWCQGPVHRHNVHCPPPIATKSPCIAYRRAGPHCASYC
jgi:hypothetical protein